MNKKIFLSGLSIMTAVALIGGATFAFFNDTETSTGNTLAAGAIDLQIDNTSYYNNATSSATSWTLRDLTIEKFFDFDDVKPGDVGEDTISLHVNDNNAWVCADVTLRSDLENIRLTNETADGDTTDDPNGGELADAINFLWWADDGDNVLESDEDVLPGGSIGALGIDETATVAVADSTESIYDTADLNADGSLNGGSTYYIGKAWCFGDIAAEPLAQDDLGPTSPRTPANSTGGVTCDGSAETNITQTDSLTADVSFRAVQSRNNGEFVCEVPETPSPSASPVVSPSPSASPSVSPSLVASGG